MVVIFEKFNLGKNTKPKNDSRYIDVGGRKLPSECEIESNFLGDDLFLSILW